MGNRKFTSPQPSPIEREQFLPDRGRLRGGVNLLVHLPTD